MTDLVAQLVAIRKAKGLKQATVARRMGVTAPAITHFERGYRTPMLSTTLRYAAAIGARLSVEEVQ
ncbi:helix-turn-helix domain-containing protein [Mycolicibacterium peregrinum]|uniref:XRE family transcriptional regulator n=1 Tax=Mycolicibacterium peregrinum TaxID=43304 RepID=A0A4Z0HKA7_MYCPR|nr:helix-turn-helix transcriptional regulator [Mycolicibacterium peregrinum]TGB37897.1 XRE family transcriptional regulator [Mycolicibacterium peregrinum]TGB38084.1 XRE family transcriptional regulator [Mycolicibacterium peregrinum]